MQQERNVHVSDAVEICAGRSQGLAYPEHAGAPPQEDYLQATAPLRTGTYSTLSAIECYYLSPTLTTYELISATSTWCTRHLYKAAQNLASQMNLNKRCPRNCNEHYFAY